MGVRARSRRNLNHTARRTRIVAEDELLRAKKRRYEDLLCTDQEDWTEDDLAFLKLHADDGWWPT